MATVTEEFTPIQKKMLGVLSDGLPHSRDELQTCLWDELAGKTAVAYHVSLIRAKLKRKGETIVCEFVNRARLYRHVRLLKSAD